nr:hypothetical protein [Moraxella osloensis]
MPQYINLIVLIRYLSLKNAMTSRQGLPLSGYCQGIHSIASLSKHQSTYQSKLKLLSAAGFIPSFMPTISESDY